MSTKLKLADELYAANGMRFLAQAYEQISVFKMQKIRRSVLKTRDFLDRLSDVFFDVKGSYKDKIIALIKKKKHVPTVNSFSTLPKNGKSVAVFLSANTRLYGDIISKVFQSFKEYANTQSEVELVIVGKLGREIYDKESSSKKAYEYFEIPDNDVSFAQLEPLIAKILDYQKVTVFYGQFVNVLNQSAQGQEITGEQPVDDKQVQRQVHFLFEPSLENILNFFETQIFTSAFKQTVHEAQLARYASRINAMEEALVNIDKRIKNIKYLKLRAQKDIQNKKLQQTIAGISLWGG
ncbi:F0F1 ATP synthase subunit gamma [Candidatus Daviesbacteria bacterium]|nr:F0F1 ATP synthase subunit gamma [Candidatus Daviesbacteria bacterium]